MICNYQNRSLFRRTLGSCASDSERRKPRLASPLLFFALLLFFPVDAHAVDIQQVVAPKSGVKAWLVENHKLPIVALHLAFEGGSEQDPVDKQGLGTLMTSALTEGAETYTATAFQQELADHSIALNFAAERDEIDGGLKCLSADKPKAFELLRLALTKPRFAVADIERLRARQLASMRQQFADPDWQARYAMLSQIFAGHPYGQRHLGTMQTLQAITQSDIQNFAAHHLARDNVTIAVAGDMTAAELSAALDDIFADVPAHAALTPIADVHAVSETPVVLVRREGTQSNVLFAMQGPKRDDPDWYAAEIANYILGGGGFSSRLMHDVRDKKGLTYGVGTSLSPSEHAGLIFGQSAVDNPKVSEALAVMRETMRHLRDDGATLPEIAAAKDYLTGAQPLALTSTDKIAGLLVYMQREKLGRDYLDRYGDIVRGVTAEDIARVIKRWFDPDKMTLVMVGKPDGITPTQIKDVVKQ